MKLDKIIAVRTGKTVYKDGGRVIKVFENGYSKADILNEALNQARVENIGINVPKVLEVKMIDGKWAIVSEFIEGKTLAQLMQENPAKKDEYLEMFVDLQMQVHAAKCPMLNKLKDKMNRKISETNLDATTRYELHTRLEGMHEHKKVCHGDFNPSNIIVKDDGTAYIIDWAHATQGNASADVAKTFLLFSVNGQAELAEKYLNMITEKCGLEKRGIQRWIPIVAAVQLKKGEVEDRKTLEKWVDVVDYE